MKVEDADGEKRSGEARDTNSGKEKSREGEGGSEKEMYVCTVLYRQ